MSAHDSDRVETQRRFEVGELTEMLRHDPDFADLRALLAGHGLLHSEVLLAGLIEGEDNGRYGVFVTRALQCFQFEIKSNGELVQWD
ncbi:hypothetical protein Dvina_19285 [Dactylosporangium vinaceum]|uniref:Uncharacterized protein n=1 Tax=Dactylosporangium vinaceum TaxID=53362 RepID=A0ABV5M9G2_9ACTN|nr:hypothetical protein [Dactylosporangium vinaceum]UAC00008.1 hypothetical protein Dvina_19285 [Dactylosporangium vinaceum]